MATDRRCLLKFLGAVKESSSSSASSVTIHGGAQRLLRRDDLNLSTEKLQLIYKEVLQRANGRLVHRYERKVGDLACLCYQNSHKPRVVFTFFHGFDGSPYDFVFTVRRFFDQLGHRVPALWLLPAGPVRSRQPSNLLNTYSLPSSPTTPQTTNACPDIDPSGGYLWWEIPVLNFITGHKKTFKIFIQALKQNLRTPQAFFDIRALVITMIRCASNDWDIPLSQTYIGGFSQGAMLASDILLATPSPLGGAIILSGAPVGRTDHKQALRERHVHRGQNPNLAVAAAAVNASQAPARLSLDNFTADRLAVPIFQSHGTKDPLIPFPIGKYLKKHLKSMGFNNLTFVSFSGTHDFTIEVGDRVFDWLLTTSPVRALAFRRGGGAGSERKGEGGGRGSGGGGGGGGGKLRAFGQKLKHPFSSRRKASAAVAVGGMSLEQEGRVAYAYSLSSVEDILSGGEEEQEEEEEVCWSSHESDVAASCAVAQGNEGVSQFEWSSFSAAESRFATEVFLSVKNLHETLILPEMDKTVDQLALRRRRSLINLGSVEDWSLMNEQIREAMELGSMDEQMSKFDSFESIGPVTKASLREMTPSTASPVSCYPADDLSPPPSWTPMHLIRETTPVATLNSWCDDDDDDEDEKQDQDAAYPVPKPDTPTPHSSKRRRRRRRSRKPAADDSIGSSLLPQNRT